MSTATLEDVVVKMGLALTDLTTSFQKQSVELAAHRREMDRRLAATEESLAKSLAESLAASEAASERTLDSLAASLAASEESLAKSLAASEAAGKKSLDSLAASLAASEESLTASLAASLAASEAAGKKSLDSLAASLAATEESLAKSLAESDKVNKETNKRLSVMMGNLGGKLGVLTELLLIPGICQLMNEFGHDFVRVCPNVKIRKDKTHTQIDLMLYDTTEAMAVEVKTQLDVEDVQWHIEHRLKKILELQREFGVEGKALYGAVAGVSVDDRARRFALDNGLYVIEIRENENIPLKAEGPEVLKVWSC